MKILEINEYGIKLMKAFTEEKTTMSKDIENDTFQGTMFYEDYIETIEDAVGWMLETYYTDAILVLDDWYAAFGDDWYVSLSELRKELEKCLE